MRIRFIDIGRGRACFTAEIEELTHASLLRAVRPHLMSSGVSFSFDESEGKGSVFVGLVRKVGRFEIENYRDRNHTPRAAKRSSVNRDVR